MLTKLKIRTDGDPCLREVSDPVENVGSSERMLLEAMLVTMKAHEGIGLAAPQVGINRRMIVVDIGEGPIAMVNPVVKEQEGACELEEGCLSVPEVTVNIVRPQTITVQYLDAEGRKNHKPFADLMARVILHEIDHLDGKLIVDYKR